MLRSTDVLLHSLHSLSARARTHQRPDMDRQRLERITGINLHISEPRSTYRQLTCVVGKDYLKRLFVNFSTTVSSNSVLAWAGVKAETETSRIRQRIYKFKEPVAAIFFSEISPLSFSTLIYCRLLGDTKAPGL